MFSDCKYNAFTTKILNLKLICRHIHRRHIFVNIQSISVHPLLWMNVMLYSIFMVFAEMCATGIKRKISK